MEHNVLSTQVILAEDVKGGQVLSHSGHLATTGTANKEPAGIAKYGGKAGERIAILTIGLIEVAQDGTLAIGDFVKADNGALAKATSKAEGFAEVSKVVNTSSVELVIR